MSELVLIGDTEAPEFFGLVSRLRQEFPGLPKHTYLDIPAWERIGNNDRSSALTVVLQSWSDEYLPGEVDRLVGATLFTGLLCCYGAWCEGDGRTHRVWPHGTRIPLRYAYQVIQAELRRIKSERPMLPPTAARDEVFLYRQSDDRPSSRPGHDAALLVSPDRLYRSTLGSVMTSCGWNVTGVSTEPEKLSGVRPPHVVVHDLDPHGDVMLESLKECRSRFPHARLFGLASQPQRSFIDDTDIVIMPRLDPMLAVDQIDSHI